MEKDWGNAALSGISMLPFMGEQFGKAGKGTKKYLLKAADATKLNRNEKFVKMLDNLDIFIKARKADIEDIRRWMRSLENLADGGDYVIEYVTPDGLIYKVRMNDDFRVNINLMDEAGDTLQDSLRVGKRVDDGGVAEEFIKGGNSLKKVKNNKEANKVAKKFGYSGAEELKQDFVFKDGAKFNMMIDTESGEIVLVSIKDSRIQVHTGLFK
jgi:hypothetical protein